MFATPAPAPRTLAEHDRVGVLRTSSDFDGAGLLSEEEVLTPRVFDRVDRPPEPARSDRWVVVALGAGASALGALALLAAGVTGVAFALWGLQP